MTPTYSLNSTVEANLTRHRRNRGNLLPRSRSVWMKWRVHFAWSKRGEQVGICSPRLHIRSIWRSGLPSSFFPPSIGLDHRQTSIHKHAKTKSVTRLDWEKELEGGVSFPISSISSNPRWNFSMLPSIIGEVCTSFQTAVRVYRI